MQESEPSAGDSKKARRPFQYGLRTLFVFTTVCAVLAAFFKYFGIDGVSILVRLCIGGLEIYVAALVLRKIVS